jgi:hypothetical protein
MRRRLAAGGIEAELGPAGVAPANGLSSSSPIVAPLEAPKFNWHARREPAGGNGVMMRLGGQYVNSVGTDTDEPGCVASLQLHRTRGQGRDRGTIGRGPRPLP